MSGINNVATRRRLSQNQQVNDQTVSNDSRDGLSPGNNNNNNRRRKILRNEPGKKFCTKKTAGIISVVLVLTLTFLYVVFYKYIGDDFNSVTEILRENIDVGNTLLDHELQMSVFLVGETLTNLLKSKLRPIQERVSSLKTQTMKYEKMEHMTGGPTSFIESSINELEAIEDNQLASLDDEVILMLINEEMQAKSLAKEASEITFRGYAILDTIGDPRLTDQGINLMPTVGIDDGKFVENLMTKHKLEDVLNALSILVKKIERRDDVFKKAKDLQLKLGVDDWLNLDEASQMQVISDMNLMNGDFQKEADHLAELYETYDEDVQSEISKNEIMYQLFLPLMTQVTDEIGNSLETVLNYVLDKRKAYLKLREMIIDDLQALKIRIINLKYKYAKITQKSL